MESQKKMSLILEQRTLLDLVRASGALIFGCLILIASAKKIILQKIKNRRAIECEKQENYLET